MNNLDRQFAALQVKKHTGLIIYLTAGIMDEQHTVDFVQQAVAAGADVIELGIPFSDPMADGPVIQEAAIKAIDNGMTVVRVLELVRKVRRQTTVPLVGMGYANSILHYGPAAFAADACEAGLDGLILPDVPHEEAGRLNELCQQYNLHLIEFVTPGTTRERIRKICTQARGFIYAVSINNVTGVSQPDYEHINKVMDMVRQETDVPVAVGFGIATPMAAKIAAQHADAVIIGSAVVRCLLDGDTDKALDLIHAVRHALDD